MRFAVPARCSTIPSPIRRRAFAGEFARVPEPQTADHRVAKELNLCEGNSHMWFYREDLPADTYQPAALPLRRL